MNRILLATLGIILVLVIIVGVLVDIITQIVMFVIGTAALAGFIFCVWFLVNVMLAIVRWTRRL